MKEMTAGALGWASHFPRARAALCDSGGPEPRAISGRCLDV